MTIIRLAAGWIHQAVDDEFSEQSLDDALRDDGVRERLLNEDVQQSDLAWLSPSEWQWFARWRQLRGGRLDDVLLDHLSSEAHSRVSRFEIRALVMNEPRTNELAEEVFDVDPRFSGHPDDTGLRFLEKHAYSTRDAGIESALELLRDTLQIATPAAQFTLRTMQTPRDGLSDVVREDLRAFFLQRNIDQDVARRWLRETDSDSGR